MCVCLPLTALQMGSKMPVSIHVTSLQVECNVDAKQFTEKFECGSFQLASSPGRSFSSKSRAEFVKDILLNSLSLSQDGEETLLVELHERQISPPEFAKTSAESRIQMREIVYKASKYQFIFRE